MLKFAKVSYWKIFILMLTFSRKNIDKIGQLEIFPFTMELITYTMKQNKTKNKSNYQIKK